MLDLWQNNTAVAAQPQLGEARDLPATFGESFSAAWQEGRLFSDTLAHGNAQAAGFDQYLEDVKNASGEDIRRQVYADADPLTAARNIVGKMKAANPGLMTIPDLTDDELDHRAIVASQQARERYMQMAAREKASGGGVGQFLGGLAAGAVDPINLVGLAVAPEVEGGVLASAAAWGTFGAVTQGVNEGVNAGFREKVQPGYGQSGEPVMNVAMAGGLGAILGGAFKALGNFWTRAKTGAWPQSVRDAGNVVESEANIQKTNVIPGIDGEVAHRTALQKSIDDIVDGRPVDVSGIFQGSVLRDYERRLDPVMQAVSETHAARSALEMERVSRQAAGQSELPFEESARQQQVETSIGKLSDGLQVLSRNAGSILPRDEAEQLARRVSTMSQDDAARTLDEFLLRPDTLRETLPSATDLAAQRRVEMEAAPAPRLQNPEQMRETLAAPDHPAALRADIDRARMLGDVKIPIGKDENGEPIFRSVDAAIKEADGYNAAAEQIQACAAPAPAEKDEAA